MIARKFDIRNENDYMTNTNDRNWQNKNMIFVLEFKGIYIYIWFKVEMT